MHTDAATATAKDFPIVAVGAGATAMATLGGFWQARSGASLAEVERRSEWHRTPAEYARYVRRFIAGLPDDPATAVPVLAHTFTDAPDTSSKEPSSSTISALLAVLQSFYDFCCRMRLLVPIQEASERSGQPLEECKAMERFFAISEIGFYVTLWRYAAKAGLEIVTSHALRHSVAKMLRQSGASIEAVSDLLGHRSIATTARYLKQLEGGRNKHWQGVATLLGD